MFGIAIQRVERLLANRCLTRGKLAGHPQGSKSGTRVSGLLKTAQAGLGLAQACSGLLTPAQAYLRLEAQKGNSSSWDWYHYPAVS
jgi:hypothetical protein